MAKYKEGYVQIGFKLYKNIAEQFEREIELWSEETGIDTSKTDMLQLLVIRFCIGRKEARKAKAKASQNKTDNKIN